MVRLQPAQQLKTQGRIGQQVGAKKRPVPTQPKIDVKQRTKEAQEKFVKEETAKADALIAEYQKTIAEFAKKQKALEGVKGARGKWNELDDDMSFYRRQIRGIEQGKKYIPQGARFQDVTSFAVSKAEAELANIAAQEAVTGAEDKYQYSIQYEKTPVQIIKMAPQKDYGFRPVTPGETSKTTTQPDYSFQPTIGTRTDIYQSPTFDIQTEPYVEKRVTGSFKDPITGKQIPTTETIYVDPTVLGKQFERPATTEEKQTLSESSDYFVSTEGRTTGEKIVSPIVGKYEFTNLGFKESFTDPFAELIVEKTKGTSFGGETGLTLDKARENIQESSVYVSNIGRTIVADLDKGTFDYEKSRFFEGVGKTGEFISGIGVGALQDVREKPFKQVLIYGGGALIGAGVKGAEFGVTSLGTKFSSRAYKALIAGRKVGFGTRAGAKIPQAYQWGVNIGGGAIGLAYAGSTIGRVAAADTALEKGEVTGVALKDVSIFAAGSTLGTKGAEKAYDIWRTRKRVEIPLEELGLAPITEVLSGEKSFVESSQFGYKGPQSGKAKQEFDIQIFRRAGRSYSATPSQFWDKQFVAAKGSSEFPGLYTAPSPSVYFLKTGGESGKIFGIYRTGGTPALANIQGGPALFTTKGITPGKGYVTGVKPEIEAVFGEGTAFALTGKQTFFKFGGRRIPLDTFKVIEVPKTTTPTTSPSNILSSYSSYIGSSPSISPVTGFAGLVSSSSRTSGKTSRTIIPSYSSGISSRRVTSSVSYRPSRKSSKVSLSISSISSSLSAPSSSRRISRSLGVPSGGSSSSKTPTPQRRPSTPINLPSFKAKPFTQQKQKGYDVQAKDKGKWTTLNRKPLTRSAAKDLGGRATDNTTSKRFRIQPSRKKKNGVLTGDMYFTANQQKFRPYKIRKGKKVPLRETYIEKTSFGIDTRGEKQGLSLAKWKAQQSQGVMGKNPFAPTTKKPTKKKSTKKVKGGKKK